MGTNKMQDISREQFEAWHAREKAAFLADGELDAARLLEAIKDTLLVAWKASREAVVVELPSASAYEGLTEHMGCVIELTYETPEHDPVGLARIPDVRSAIEAHGLKVAP